MAQAGIHIVKLRKLRNELRRAREAAGLTQKQVAEDLGWSISKVIRQETGAANIVTGDVMALTLEYGITDPVRRNSLLAITRQKEQDWWWDEYREIYERDYPQLLNFVAFEDSAIAIQVFHGLIVPGLLQTERYMRALMAVLDDPQVVEAGVQVRLRRQELLRREQPPQLSIVLDESVVHRVIGGYDAMIEQLGHIKNLNSEPRITVQIVPYTAGSVDGMNRSFTVLDLGEEEGAVDYVVNAEDINSDTLIRDSPEAASHYVEAFYKIRERALTTEETDRLVESTIDGMTALS